MSKNSQLRRSAKKKRKNAKAQQPESADHYAARMARRTAQEAADAEQRARIADELKRDAILGLTRNGELETGIVKDGSAWKLLDTDVLASPVSFFKDPVNAVVVLYGALSDSDAPQPLFTDHVPLKVWRRGVEADALLAQTKQALQAEFDAGKLSWDGDDDGLSIEVFARYFADESTRQAILERDGEEENEA